MRMADTLFLDFEGEGPKGPDSPQLISGWPVST